MWYQYQPLCRARLSGCNVVQIWRWYLTDEWMKYRRWENSRRALFPFSFNMLTVSSDASIQRCHWFLWSAHLWDYHSPPSSWYEWSVQCGRRPLLLLFFNSRVGSFTCPSNWLIKQWSTRQGQRRCDQLNWDMASNHNYHHDFNSFL